MAEERSWLDFIKDNATLIIGGGLGFGAFTMSGGGFMGMLLGAAAFAGTMLFGGALMNKAQPYIDPILPEFLRGKSEPQKSLPIKIEKKLSQETPSDKPKASIVSEGEVYDIIIDKQETKTVKENGKDVAKVFATEVSYQKQGDTTPPKKFNMSGGKVEIADLVDDGSGGAKLLFNKDSIVEKKIFAPLNDLIIKEKRQALETAKVADVHALVGEDKVYIAYSNDGKKAYKVKAEGTTGFTLHDLDDRQLAKVDNIVDPDMFHPTKGAGALSRRIGEEIKIAEAAGLMGTVVGNVTALPPADNKAALIGPDPVRNGNAVEGTLEANKVQATYKVTTKTEGGVPLVETVEITLPDGRVITGAPKDKVIGNFGGAANAYVSDNAKLTQVLEDTIKADAEELKGIDKQLKKLDGDRYLIEHKGSSYIITAAAGGKYSIKDVGKNSDEATAVETKGDAGHALREALHKILEIKEDTPEVNPLNMRKSAMNQPQGINAIQPVAGFVPDTSSLPSKSTLDAQNVAGIS